MNIGTIIEGKISSIKNFGIFITFENTFGFCHISELTKEYIKNISDKFSLNQIVKAKIISINDGKINLSLKQLEMKDSKNNLIDKPKKIFQNKMNKTNKKHDIINEDPFELMMKNYLKSSEDNLHSINNRIKKHNKL